VTKKKKLVKKALKHPDLFSFGELAFFQRWLEEKKARKALEKSPKEEPNPEVR
jgi:hypothetical protein